MDAMSAARRPRPMPRPRPGRKMPPVQLPAYQGAADHSDSYHYDLGSYRILVRGGAPYLGTAAQSASTTGASSFIAPDPPVAVQHARCARLERAGVRAEEPRHEMLQPLVVGSLQALLDLGASRTQGSAPRCAILVHRALAPVLGAHAHPAQAQAPSRLRVVSASEYVEVALAPLRLYRLHFGS